MEAIQEQTVTTLEPENQIANEGKSLAQIPSIFWAPLIIFSVNTALAAWFFLSPSLTIRADLERLHPLDERGMIVKTSPFEQFQPEVTKRTRAVAPKMTPVLQPVETSVDMAMPVGTVRSSDYISGARMYELLETQMQKVSRVSASLSEPMRRLSERALQHIETKVVPSVTDSGRSLNPAR